MNRTISFVRLVEPQPSEMLSLGGGVNSIAMVIKLVNGGWRGPIVMANTGGENPNTYCYIEYFTREFLEPHGLEITWLSPVATPQFYRHDKRLLEHHTLENYCLAWGIIPLLAVRWCTTMFKREPLEAYRKAHDIDIALLGICASEPRRVRNDPRVRYPLYEEDITRPECRRIIQREGLNVPIKSGCFFCPGQSLAQWRRLFYDYPDLYERAIQLEDNASKYNQKWATLDPHGISLREHARRRWKGQMEMDLSRWLPCACSL